MSPPVLSSLVVLSSSALAGAGPCPDLPGGSCWRSGFEARWSRGALDEAAPLWARGCEAGEALACLAWADLARSGPGRDLEVAASRAERACAAGLASACGVAADTRALRDAERRCLANGERCREACARGLGPEVCAAAVPGIVTTCAHDAPATRASRAAACTQLGTLANRGVAVPLDLDEANRLLWMGCDLDDAWGCLRLGANLDAGRGRDPSPKSRAWLRQQVCDLQLVYGCAPHR